MYSGKEDIGYPYYAMLESIEINEWRFNMKTIRVVAAIIIEKEKVFATQRGCDL